MPLILIAVYTGALIALIQVSRRSRPLRNADSSRYQTYSESLNKNLSSRALKIRDNPFQADLGITISTLYDIDLSAGSYYAEGYAWLKYADVPLWVKEWDPEIYECPVQTIAFINVVERQDFSQTPEPSLPDTDDDGRKIHWLAFSGRFVATEADLDLRLFPFETITLPIDLEIGDFYVGEAEVNHRDTGPILTAPPKVNGYSCLSSIVRKCMHVYQTNWGFEYARNYFDKENHTEFIAFKVETVFRRNAWNSFFNIFLPLIIVMVVVIAAPLVAIQDYQTKLAIPASALLVLVFLQDGYKKILPPGLNYPTLADLIYIYNMLITIVVFLWSLMQTKLYFASQVAGTQVNQVQVAGSMDNYFFVITLAFAVLAPCLFYASCRRRQSVGNQS
jgi:hypothetical protein